MGGPALFDRPIEKLKSIKSEEIAVWHGTSGSINYFFKFQDGIIVSCRFSLNDIMPIYSYQTGKWYDKALTQEEAEAIFGSDGKVDEFHQGYGN